MRLVATAIVLGALLAAPASAQQPPTEPPPTAARLLDTLKSAQSEQDAALIETRVILLWTGKATPAVRLLLGRAERELRAGNSAEAVKDFNAVLTLQPELADVWRQRGEARLASGDAAGAVADFSEAVKREPREFLAWRALANVAAERGDWKSAYAAWTKLLLFDPHTPGATDRLKLLRRKALGEET